MLGLALLPLLALPLAGSRGDDLAVAFRTWLRKGWASKAELTTTVFNRMRRRGKREDGVRIVKGLLLEADERGGRRARAAQLRALRSRATKPGIQQAVRAYVDRTISIRRTPGKPDKWSFRKPGQAALFLPMLGAFDPNRHLDVLRAAATSAVPELYMAAAEGLRLTDSAAALPDLVEVLPHEYDKGRDLARGRRLLRWIYELYSRRGRRDEPAAAATARTLEALLRRARDLGWKHAILPVLTEMRRKSTVGVLIDEFCRTSSMLARPKAPVPTPTCFWLSDVHDALKDLTGFSAGAGRVQAWRDFWRRERATFHVWPEDEARRARRHIVRGFCGVRVRGRNVLFVVDTSASMRRKLMTKKGKSRSAFIRQELMHAVDGLEPDVRFNAILFSTGVVKFSPRPMPASSYHVKRFRTWLGNAQTGGETRLLDALQSGLEGRVFANHNAFRRSIDEVFVVSDGIPAEKPRRILESVARWNKTRACRIHVVCLGLGDGAEKRRAKFVNGKSPGVEFLKRLAEQNGGEFKIIQ